MAKAKKRNAVKKGEFRMSIGVSPLLSEVPKIFGEWGKDLNNFEDAFKKLSEVFAKQTVANIRGRTGYEGSWTANQTGAKRWIKRKARMGYGRAELYFRGPLVGQVSSPRGGYRMIKDRFMSWGTKNLKYAAAVNFGRLKGTGNKPRHFFGFAKGDPVYQKYQEIFTAEANKKTNRARAALMRGA